MGWDSDDEKEQSIDPDLLNEEVDLAAYSPRTRSPEMFRVVASYPLGHRRDGPEAAPKPNMHEDIFARAPGMTPTWGAVRDHLRWERVPSTFISFFIKFDMAKRWKDNFLREGAYRVRIFCYNTKNVHLLDANELARELSLHTLEHVGKRHYHEYLVLDRVSGKECMGCITFNG